MKKESKDEKALTHSLKIIDTICIESNDDILVDEYKKLSAQYKKLLNRSNRIVKISDSMQSSITNDNESLKEDKDKIIKFSKKKIFDNISSKREIKEQHTEQVLDYTNIINNSKQKISLYEKEITDVKFTLKITHKKLEKARNELVQLDKMNDKLLTQITVLKESQIAFENILEKEIISTRNANETLILGMYGIDNFVHLKNKLFEFTTEETFILGILRYLKSSLNKIDIVVYFEAEMFYILMPNIAIKDAINKLQKIARKRIIHKNNITFSGSVTYLTPEDDGDSIMERCFDSYNNAILSNNVSYIIKA